MAQRQTLSNINKKMERKNVGNWLIEEKNRISINCSMYIVPIFSPLLLNNCNLFKRNFFVIVNKNI